ncbi:MAG: FliG C-terminal domain-containing protein, partial [Planctomycetota bacterium]
VNMSYARKAAALLMSLDAETANQLVKDLPAEKVEGLALELAQIEASGNITTEVQTNVVREFYDHLYNRDSDSGLKTSSLKGFINNILIGTLGQEKAKKIESHIQTAIKQGDPFLAIKDASAIELSEVLKEEQPKTIAVILSELQPKKSQEILTLLTEEIQTQTIYKMTCLGEIRPDLKQLIASMVEKKLKLLREVSGPVATVKKEDPLRKLAVMLRGLENELRSRLIEEVSKQNKETAENILIQMVNWTDIPLVADRSLQEALRSIDSAQLAKALFEADEMISEKIKTNISERAKESITEEMSLMQEPEQKEIDEAREAVLEPLREANKKGELKFVEK